MPDDGRLILILGVGFLPEIVIKYLDSSGNDSFTVVVESPESLEKLKKKYWKYKKFEFCHMDVNFSADLTSKIEFNQYVISFLPSDLHDLLIEVSGSLTNVVKASYANSDLRTLHTRAREEKLVVVDRQTPGIEAGLLDKCFTLADKLNGKIFTNDETGQPLDIDDL